MIEDGNDYDWGFDYYCSEPRGIRAAMQCSNTPAPTRAHVGDSANMPRWCPFVDFSAWDKIEELVPYLTPSRIDQQPGGTHE